jgi:hypothetical protein
MATTQFWGPVAVWFSALASFLAVTVALLGGLGWFTRRRQPVLTISFEQQEPWCRQVERGTDSPTLWIRVAVENEGKDPARGCVGRLTGFRTNDAPRRDIDPVQLRWAGFPRSRSFEPIDLRRGQREFLDVMYLPSRPGADWGIDTFGGDFDPGFTTHLRTDQVHVLQITLFADNADSRALSLRIEVVDDQPRVASTAVK